MRKEKLLQLVQHGEISPMQAYSKMYNRSLKKRSSMCKVSIRLGDESFALNAFLGCIFFMPMPLFIFKHIAVNIKELQAHFSKNEIMQLMAYMKGTRVSVMTKEQKVNIRISIF